MEMRVAVGYCACGHSPALEKCRELFAVCAGETPVCGRRVQAARRVERCHFAGVRGLREDCGGGMEGRVGGGRVDKGAVTKERSAFALERYGRPTATLIWHVAGSSPKFTAM